MRNVFINKGICYFKFTRFALGPQFSNESNSDDDDDELYCLNFVFVVVVVVVVVFASIDAADEAQSGPRCAQPTTITQCNYGPAATGTLQESQQFG